MNKALTSFISRVEVPLNEDSFQDSCDIFLPVQFNKLPKDHRLLKYNEKIAKDSSFTKKEQINVSNPASIQCNHKKIYPLVIQRTENECLTNRNNYISQITDSENPISANHLGLPSMVSSLEINPSDITHSELILGLYFHLTGWYCFNMDNLKKFYNNILKINFNCEGMFILCTYDLFHKVDLRIKFYAEREYEILVYGSKDNHISEEDVWDGAFVSEFIRLMICHSTDKWSLPLQVVLEDIVDLEKDIKIEYELLETLLKYLPKCLMTGFDTTCGYNEVDYLNNNMTQAIIFFFKLEASDHPFLHIFLKKLTLLLDSHECYLITYLYLLVEFEVFDEYFMELISQVFNFIDDPYLVKQYLRLQLKFFERNEDMYFDMCYEISKKMYQMDPVQPFVYLNFINYNYKAKNNRILLLLLTENKNLNFKVDLIDSYYAYYKTFWSAKFVANSFSNLQSLKSYEIEFFRRKCDKHIRHIENVKNLIQGNTFFAFPCREHCGYLESIWNSKPLFEDMKAHYFDTSITEEPLWEEKAIKNEPLKDLYKTQILLLKNITLNSLRKTIISDEVFGKMLVENVCNLPIKGLNILLDCYKQTLGKLTAYNESVVILAEEMSLVAHSFYFTGFYKKSFEILMFQLDEQFTIKNFVLLKQVITEWGLENLSFKKQEIDAILKFVVFGISYESRCFNDLQYSTVMFIKNIMYFLLIDLTKQDYETILDSEKKLIINRHDALVKKTLDIIAPLINKSLANKVVSLFNRTK
ncbi:hypothetical protein QEN19_003099 [Hanseniaspora menglaensis]